MGALGVVERKVRAESASQRIVGLVSFEVNVCVFDAAPEALAKDVVTFFSGLRAFLTVFPAVAYSSAAQFDSSAPNRVQCTAQIGPIMDGDDCRHDED